MPTLGRSSKREHLEEVVISKMAKRVGVGVDRKTIEDVQRDIEKQTEGKGPKAKPKREWVPVTSFTKRIRQLLKRPEALTLEPQHKADSTLMHKDENMPFALKPGYDKEQRALELYKSTEEIKERQGHGKDKANANACERDHSLFR